MFQATTTGYLVQCDNCGNEEIAATIRLAKNTFDFHECTTTPNKIFDYTLIEATDPVEYTKPLFSTSPH